MADEADITSALGEDILRATTEEVNSRCRSFSHESVPPSWIFVYILVPLGYEIIFQTFQSQGFA
jgi:hypothetical protein